MKKAINENIHNLRLANKMTLEDLAKAVGTSRQTIQRYETGEISNIPYEKITSIAEALHTSPQALMGWNDVTVDMNDGSLIVELYNGLPHDSRERLIAYAKKLKELYDMEG